LLYSPQRAPPLLVHGAGQARVWAGRGAVRRESRVRELEQIALIKQSQEGDFPPAFSGSFRIAAATNLKFPVVERAFRSLKTVDLKVRSIHVENRGAHTSSFACLSWSGTCATLVRRCQGQARSGCSDPTLRCRCRSNWIRCAWIIGLERDLHRPL